MVEGKFGESIFRSLVNDIAIKTRKPPTTILRELSDSFSVHFSALKDYYYISKLKNKRGIKFSVFLDLLTEWKKICRKSESEVEDVMFKIFEYPLYDGRKAAFLPIFLSESLAELVGILYGDGSIPRGKWYIQVTDGRKEPLEYVSRLFTKLFGIDKPKIKKDKNSNSYTLRVRSKILVLYFLHFFDLPHGPKKEILRIPPLILNSEDKILAAFIRGLFSSDGSFKRNEYITLEMAQENLIKEIKEVLEKRFNIRLHLNKNRGCWVIKRYSEKVIQKFLRKIGILEPYKCQE